MENIQQETVAKGVAAAVLHWFRTSTVAQKKHPAATEWTVLAGIVLHITTDKEDATSTKCTTNTEHFRALACGTGTKCLGQRDLDVHGLVVNDSHAEIIARRAFLRYLYSEIMQWIHSDDDESRQGVEKASIFERHPTTQKLRLKPGHQLHLYVSEAPCGDGAIYPLREDVVDKLVEQRTQRENETADTERSEVRLTGAKQKRPSENANKSDGSKRDKRFEQLVGIARTKSGRSDLPVDKQTLSMSCSDKIAKWLGVGLQGVLLLQWFEPVRLSSVVVAADVASQSRAAQQRALERALWDRVSNLESVPPVTLTVLPTTRDDAVRFDRARDATKSPSSLSLNWTHTEPHWSLDGRQSSHLQSRDIEVVMSATGFKQGAKKASKMDKKTKIKVASRLCKWRLFQVYSATVGSGHDSMTSYRDEKAAVLEKERLQDKHREIKLLLGEWVGVPAYYKAFTLDES